MYICDFHFVLIVLNALVFILDRSFNTVYLPVGRMLILIGSA